MSLALHHVAEPAPVQLADEDLVARVRAGDSRLFEILMRRHNERLFRVARAVVRDETEAEDVMQEAYVRAFTHLDQFRGEAAFATWLTKIALYEAFARVRRRRRGVALEDALQHATERGDASMHTMDTPEDQAGRGELRRLLTTVIDDLPEPLRLVFVLRDVEGVSTAETARCLGLSVANTKVRLHRARAALRRAINRHVGDEISQLYDFHLVRCDRVVDGVFKRLGLLGSGPPASAGSPLDFKILRS